MTYEVDMTKSVFRFRYDTRTKIVLWVIFSIFTLLTVREILCLTGVFAPFSIPVDATSLAISGIIVITVSSMLFFSRYVVKSNRVYIKMGIFIQKIPCGLISSVVKYKDLGYYVFYTSLNAKPCQIKINVLECDIDGFFDAIKSYNHLITYEVVKEDTK